MANTKSAKKQIRKIENKTKINIYWKNSIKNNIKSFLDKLNSNKDKNEVLKEYNKVKSVVDKAAQRNLIKKSKAARIKSRLNKKIK